MATPSPATNLPTRQQLDEIDALLKRMLSLAPLAGEPAEPLPDSPAPAITYPAPTVREVPPPREPLPAEPVVREWRVEWPHAPAPQPSSVVAWGSPAPAGPPMAFAAAPVVAPASYAVPVSAEHLPFAATVPVSAPYVPGQPPPSTAQPPAALPVQFLVLVNGTFNVLTYLLGPLGTWLRGPGRNALGWCGILMLLAAGAWAAGEWVGYEWPAIDLSRFGGPTLGRWRPALGNRRRARKIGRTPAKYLCRRSPAPPTTAVMSSPKPTAPASGSPPPPVKLDYVAAVLSYLIPGLGQLTQGRVRKGLLFLVCLYALFFYGMYLGKGQNVYLPDNHAGEPGTVNRLASDIYTRFQFVGQFPIGMAAWPAVYQYYVYKPEVKHEDAPLKGWMRAPSIEEVNNLQRDGDKTWDLGWVYTVIAGVLNVLVIYDALAGPAFRETKAPQPTGAA